MRGVLPRNWPTSASLHLVRKPAPSRKFISSLPIHSATALNQSYSQPEEKLCALLSCCRLTTSETISNRWSAPCSLTQNCRWLLLTINLPMERVRSPIGWPSNFRKEFMSFIALRKDVAPQVLL